MMRKFALPLALLLAVLLLFNACGEATKASVEEIGSKGLKFTANGDGTCYVSGIGTCSDTDLVIPAKSPAGNRVTDIGYAAFSGCASLTSISIPDSVTGIGDYAFSDCTSLTNISIPDSVINIPNSATSIGASVFENCTALQYNIYDNAKYLGNANNPYVVLVEATDAAITSCNIHPDTKIIYFGAFSLCNSLADVAIGNSVVSIGTSAFWACVSLKSITIPNSVVNIGMLAFMYCRSLTSITIPSNVTNIEKEVFSNCTSLESITVAADNPVYHSAGNCIIETESKTLIAGCKNSIIPNDGSVTSIGMSALSNCKFTSLFIPDSVKSIGISSFSGCSDLTSIIIPSSVTDISFAAFAYCTSLTSVSIPRSVKSINEHTFDSCTSLTNITYQGTMTEWKTVRKSSDWDANTGSYTVHCTDGDIAKENN